MNPIWTHMISKAVAQVIRVCTSCKRAGTYKRKRPGQFYKCKRCGHRFKEKER